MGGVVGGGKGEGSASSGFARVGAESSGAGRRQSASAKLISRGRFAQKRALIRIPRRGRSYE
jgi:hypothetical protein